MLKEYMVKVVNNLEKHHPKVVIGMVDLEKAPILEARFQPINPPDFRLF